MKEHFLPNIIQKRAKINSKRKNNANKILVSKSKERKNRMMI